MRIAPAQKTETRRRILATAAKLFSRDGWEATTTKSLARAAGIATGTLFNYFPTKEAVAAALAHAALVDARAEFLEQLRGDESLEEELFSLIWTGLRRLLPYRGFLGAALNTVLSPLARPPQPDPGDALRAEHLEEVMQVLARHGASGVSVVHLQVYWSLYLGVLHHWAADTSPQQADTLALVDQSVILLVAALREQYDLAGEETPTGEAADAFPPE